MSGFSVVKGQAAAVEILNSALESGKIAHAYLFNGPRGVGKKLVATIFARGLNCKGNNKPCDVCIPCQKALHNNHPDLFFLKPEGQSFKIEQVRQLQRMAYAKVYEGEYKVFIVEDMHKATLQAYNSLLKILEDPPDRAIFILISENTQAVPPTVLSRCQKINFAPLASEVVCEELEQRGYAIERARLSVELAFGSLGNALEIIEDDQLFHARKQALLFLQGAFSKNYFSIYKAIEAYEKDKLNLEQFIEQLLFLLRDYFLWQIGGMSKTADSEALSTTDLSREQLQKALDIVLQAVEWQRKQANSKLVLDVLGLRLARLA